MKLLMYSSATCYPCKMITPVIASLVEELNIPFEKVVLPDNPYHFEVRSVPTFILVDEDNNELRRIVGAVPRTQLKEFLT